MQTLKKHDSMTGEMITVRTFVGTMLNWANHVTSHQFVVSISQFVFRSLKLEADLGEFVG